MLYEAMKLREEVVNREREELQSLISDVTHQVRTPMTNLRMLNETLLASALEQQSESAQTAASDKAEKREYESQVQFLQSAQKQIQRLDFLMEALIKTSRLETGLYYAVQKGDAGLRHSGRRSGRGAFSCGKKEFEHHRGLQRRFDSLL